MSNVTPEPIHSGTQTPPPDLVTAAPHGVAPAGPVDPPVAGGPPAAVDPPEPPARRRDLAAEAANRRHELREVESHRDSLVEQLTTVRRSSIEDLLARTTTDLRGDGTDAPSLVNPRDLWEFLGAKPDDFYAEDGRLDRAALADYVLEHTADRTYLRQVAFQPPQSLQRHYTESMRRDMTTRHGGDSGAAWQSALSPNS